MLYRCAKCEKERLLRSRMGLARGLHGDWGIFHVMTRLKQQQELPDVLSA